MGIFPIKKNRAVKLLETKNFRAYYKTLPVRNL